MTNRERARELLDRLGFRGIGPEYVTMAEQALSQSESDALSAVLAELRAERADYNADAYDAYHVLTTAIARIEKLKATKGTDV